MRVGEPVDDKMVVGGVCVKARASSDQLGVGEGGNAVGDKGLGGGEKFICGGAFDIWVCYFFYFEIVGDFDVTFL